jgi:hypothetical protein
MTATNDKRWLIIFFLFLIAFLGVWQMATLDYKGQSMPGPIPVAKSSWEFISDPFYDNGPNDKGIGTLTLYSLGRLTLGFCAGTLVAIFLGVILGLNQTLYRALNPFMQIRQFMGGHRSGRGIAGFTGIGVFCLERVEQPVHLQRDFRHSGHRYGGRYPGFSFQPTC